MSVRRPHAAVRLTRLEDRTAPAAVGALDPSFGSAGVAVVPVTFNLPASDAAVAVATGPGGTVLVGTSIFRASGDADFAVVRLTAAGALDKSFGSNGIAAVAFDLGGTNRDVLSGV